MYKTWYCCMYFFDISQTMWSNYSWPRYVPQGVIRPLYGSLTLPRGREALIHACCCTQAPQYSTDSQAQTLPCPWLPHSLNFPSWYFRDLHIQYSILPNVGGHLTITLSCCFNKLHSSEKTLCKVSEYDCVDLCSFVLNEEAWVAFGLRSRLCEGHSSSSVDTFGPNLSKHASRRSKHWGALSSIEASQTIILIVD